MRTRNRIANDIVRAFNQVAEQHGADIPMGDLAALIYLVEAELDGVHAAATVHPPEAETAAKLAALVESAEKLRNVVEGPDAPEAPSPADEELVPHRFVPHNGDWVNDIWCKDCAYHRDYPIHVTADAPEAP